MAYGNETNKEWDVIWFGACDIRSLVINSIETSNNRATSIGVLSCYEIIHKIDMCNKQSKPFRCLVEGKKMA
jgi:hypothetical protein